MFLTNLNIEIAGTQVYILKSPLVYKNEQFTITVFNGFDFDGASIPQALWGIIGSPMTGGYQRAACLHDALYASRVFSKEVCDLLFYEAMRDDGVSKFRAKMMYYAVKIAGNGAYNSAIEDMAKYRGYISVEIN